MFEADCNGHDSKLGVETEIMEWETKENIPARYMQDVSHLLETNSTHKDIPEACFEVSNATHPISVIHLQLKGLF